MIITKIWGGLGNQLFEYALGRKLSLAKNTELKLDTSQFRKDTRRVYDIYHFNIAGSVANRIVTAKFKLLNLFDSSKPYYKKHIVQDQGFYFDPNIFSISDNSFIQGYWQSEKYFKDIEDTIRKDITLKEQPGQKYHELLNEINNSNSISIHVRRADYLSPKNLKVFALCTPDYYKKAVEIIAEKTGSLKLFFFADDIAWLKQTISTSYPSKFVSAQGLTDCQELMLMSACKHNIVANSSFSWWGAWLNTNPGKIVIAPEKWVVNPARHNKDLLPQEWIKL